MAVGANVEASPNGRGPTSVRCVLPGFSERFLNLATRLLPEAVDSSLLRATLLRGEAAQRAWSEWCLAVGDPVKALGTDDRHVKVLVPLLGSNLRANDISVDPAFATYAKAAYLTETMRMTAYLQECGRALALLDSHCVGQVVLKGAALASTIYPEAALRHAHDFDVLVREQDLARANDVLQSNGFLPSRSVGDGLHHLAPLRNARGFVVELHRRPAQIYPGFEAAGVWARSVPAHVAGQATRVPARADSLLLVALHAATGGGTCQLRWVCDAWLLADGMSDAEWHELADIAAASSASLPLVLVLGYLHNQLGPIGPGEVIDRIAKDAAKTDAIGRQALTFGARQALPADLAGILRMRGSWRDRLDQLAWRLAPPPVHVRWAFGYTGRWQLLRYYPGRFLKLAGRTGGTSTHSRAT